MNPALLPPREIDIEILPVRRKYGRPETEQPRLHEIILEAEYPRQLGHVGSGELGHLAGGDDSLGVGRAAQELFGNAVVFAEFELTYVDALRLLAIELQQFRVARRRAAPAAEVHLVLAFFQLFDRILERRDVKIHAQPDRVHAFFYERLDLARYRARAQRHRQRQRSAVRRLAIALGVEVLVPEPVEQRPRRRRVVERLER